MRDFRHCRDGEERAEHAHPSRCCRCSSWNEWGGTLLEVAVLTVIGVDLCGYRGLVVDAVALARRRSRGRQGHRAQVVTSRSSAAAASTTAATSSLASQSTRSPGTSQRSRAKCSTREALEGRGSFSQRQLENSQLSFHLQRKNMV